MKRNIVLGVLLLSAIYVGSLFMGHVSAQKEVTYGGQLASRPDAPLLVENFDNPVGTLITSTGWTAHSSGGTNAIAVTAPGLTYTGYGSSNIGNAVTLATSGEDINRTFATQSLGSVYAAVLVNISEASVDPAGGYFFHLGPDPISTTFRGRLFIKKDGSNNVAFGISKAGADTVFTPFSYSLNTTYLLVVKYTIVAGDANDTVSLIVNPSLPGVEPTPTVSATDVTGGDINPSSIAIRQGSASTSPTMRVDGVRIATSWDDAVVTAGGGATPTPTPAATPTPSGSPTPGPTPNTTARVFTARLNGAMEVPANASTGTGFGRVVLNAAENEITASFYWNNLSSGTVSGHIHTGAVGVNGPITFIMAPNPGVTSGSAIDRTFAISPAQVSNLRAGLMYFNIHTTNFAGGEIRGQIVSNLPDAPLDFNGDGKTDFGVVRGTSGAGGTQVRWFNLLNTPAATETQVDFGVISDRITPGDFDGDGKDDIAVWRSETNNSSFYILQSSTNTVRVVRFGQPNDDPFIIADYDGDGIDDPAIYRPGDSDTNSQSFFWWYGSNGIAKNREVPVAWGLGRDSAVPGDYNGDGFADFCVARQVGTRLVFFILDGNGKFDTSGNPETVTRFGLPVDSVVPGDYDGDGKTDLAVSRFEGLNIAWYYLPSSGGPYIRRVWGRRDGDVEVQGDYDGDGKTDFAIWRSSNPSTFFALRSSDGNVLFQRWGLFGDIPSAFDAHNN